MRAVRQRLDDFTLRHLRFIITAADEGSFRRAASALGVQQSTLSRTVRDMEDAIGATLFARSHAGVAPTFAGRRLVALTRDALASMGDAANDVARAGTVEHGTLHIGWPVGQHADCLITPLLSFGGAHPEVRIEFTEADLDTQFRALRHLRIDLMFAPGTPSADQCCTEHIGDAPVFVAMSAADPLQSRSTIQPSDLAARRLLFRRTDPALGIFRTWLSAIEPSSGSLSVETQPIQAQAPLMQLVALRRCLTLTVSRPTDHPGVVCRALSRCRLPFSALWARSNPNPALHRFLSVTRASRQMHLTKGNPSRS